MAAPGLRKPTVRAPGSEDGHLEGQEGWSHRDPHLLLDGPRPVRLGESRSSQTSCLGGRGRQADVAAAERCPEPASVDNSILVVKEEEGRLVGTFLCVNGYHLVGEKTLLCDASGQWSAPAPTCLAGHCPDPVLHHGKSSTWELARAGDNVTFTCAEGHVLKGSSWSQCREDHAWEPPLPICKSRHCGPPGNLSHGYFEGEDFNSGSVITYHCEERYRLVGVQERRCVDGDWAGEPPECERIPDSPEAVAQAQLKEALLAFQEKKEFCKAIENFMQRLKENGFSLEEVKYYLEMKKAGFRPQ
ncbi:C4b-binding protein beta chain [Talpa occidentalis]|uniref:C4b-binding protein beta chain n=1 Tax=Talpa occidentalis TaxID=50954 RepID=UPI0018902262|nr:C4b-binding protein beta chain [Talpa occidentalis]